MLAAEVRWLLIVGWCCSVLVLLLCADVSYLYLLGVVFWCGVLCALSNLLMLCATAID